MAVNEIGIETATRDSGSQFLEVVIRTAADRSMAVAALARATERVGVSTQGVEMVRSAVSSEGVVAELFVRSKSSVLPWVHELARALETEGLSGELSLANFELCPVDPLRDPVACAFAAMVFPPDEAQKAAVVLSRPASSVAERLLTHAVSWVTKQPGEIFFLHGAVSGRADREDLVDLAAQAMKIGPPFTLVAVEEPTFRAVNVDVEGHVLYQAAGGSGWRQDVEELETVIDRFADAVIYAGLGAGWGLADSWDSGLNTIKQTTLAARGNYLRFLTADDETRTVPDAYGIQLLTERHLARARDLSRWTVTSTGRLHWVRSPDLEPWFGTPEQRAVVLQRARSDFGDVLLTEEARRAAKSRWRARQD